MATKALKDFYDTHATAVKITERLPLKTANEIRHFSGLPWLPLKTPYTVPHEAMLAEAQNLHEHYVPHRSIKEDNQGWLSLCIHGLSSVHTGYNSRPTVPFDWTDICKFCPVTHEFFRDTFGYDEYHRVRFMLLKPGGYILPHSDSTLDRLEAINIALNHPVGCDFVMEDCGIVPFKPGAMIMLSLSRKHIVWNQSNEDRYHIIVHGNRNNIIWDKIVKKSYDEY